MRMVNFCLAGLVSLFILDSVIAISPQLDKEAITIPSFQFRSQTTIPDVCTAYQLRGRLFVTLAHCLGGNHSATGRFTKLDVVGQGMHNVQVLALRGRNSKTSEHMVVVTYDGPLERHSDRRRLKRQAPSSGRLNSDDPMLSEAKEIFQDLMPYRKKHFEALSDEAVHSTLVYLSSASDQVHKYSKDNEAYIAVWYDTAGNYLRSYLLPITKYCFYAGNVSYESVYSVITYFRNVKHYLDTDGSEWPSVPLNITNFQVTISPLNTTGNHTACSELMFDSAKEIPLPMMQMDDESKSIISLWVPLKSKQVYDPRSKSSLSILRIYYETVRYCIPSIKRTHQLFSSRLIQWIARNLTKHLLDDDEFYPGFESILRVKKSLESDIGGEPITADVDKLGIDSRGFLANLFGENNNTFNGEYAEDEQSTHQKQKLIIMVVASFGFIIAMFIVVVIIVKIRQNRKTLTRKAGIRRWNENRNNTRKNDEVDGERLPMSSLHQVKRNSSNFRVWKTPTSTRKNSSKIKLTKRELTFTDSDTEDTEFDAFYTKKMSTEQIPLIKRDKHRTNRCGEGCFCATCSRRRAFQSSSAYKLVTESPEQPAASSSGAKEKDEHKPSSI